MNLQEIIAEISDHIRGMWRYRWQALAIAWVVALFGWYFVFTMPNIYNAWTKVSVDTNSLLPALTKGLTASENLLDEVGLVSRAMLTRPNLEVVARETDLDLRAETPQELELLITDLQRQVEISGGRDGIFTISYSDWNRDKAREVVAALLKTFVEDSLGAQGDDADMTERALSLEIADHEQRLVQAESDLAEFKKRNLGYMPDDDADYYTRLQNALSAVSEVDRQIRQMQQKRDEISRQLGGEEPVFGLMSTPSVQSIGNCSRAGDIAQLQGQLSALLVDFTEKHPRVVMLRETVASLEEECRTELASTPNTPRADPLTQSLDTNLVYQNLRLQLSNAEVELAALREQYGSSQREVAQLRADVDKIGQVETDFKRLNRDYGVVETRHQELLRRWETLQSKKRIDPVTDQIQFNIIEPPFAAARPVAPNRAVLLSGVLIFSIGAGLAAAFGLNQLKPVFYTRHSVARVTGLPVLGSVSMIMSPDDISHNRRMALLWGGGNIALIMLVVCVIVFERQVRAAIGILTGTGA